MQPAAAAPETHRSGPAFGLPETQRNDMLDAAVRIASAVRYRGVGTIEFLVDAERFVFMEANARLQVEHTVTEEVTGLDLVAIQLRIAAGATLTDLGLGQSRIPPTRGVALQARVNLETMHADGTSRPGGGLITAYDPPAARAFASTAAATTATPPVGSTTRCSRSSSYMPTTWRARSARRGGRWRSSASRACAATSRSCRHC